MKEKGSSLTNSVSKGMVVLCSEQINFTFLDADPDAKLRPGALRREKVKKVSKGPSPP